MSCSVCGKDHPPFPMCHGTIDTEMDGYPLSEERLNEAERYSLECIAASKEGLPFNQRFLLAMVKELRERRAKSQKRLGVAAILESGGRHSLHVLLGRRGKDPNRGLYVLPGGGVEKDESLEEALSREVSEETGLLIERRLSRWERPQLVELEDRIVLIAQASVLCRAEFDDEPWPKKGSDLYDVRWFTRSEVNAMWTERQLSPVVHPILASWGWAPSTPRG